MAKAAKAEFGEPQVILAAFTHARPAEVPGCVQGAGVAGPPSAGGTGRGAGQASGRFSMVAAMSAAA